MGITGRDGEMGGARCIRCRQDECRCEQCYECGKARGPKYIARDHSAQVWMCRPCWRKHMVSPFDLYRKEAPAARA